MEWCVFLASILRFRMRTSTDAQRSNPPRAPLEQLGWGRVLGAEDITRTLRCCSALSRLEPTRLQWCCRWRAPEIGPLDP